mgnify:CR=1 FL=1|tara:strand:- start:93 stop:953 length:861 start_codon:yes stop_codon:yes gene_type:complete
MNKNLLKKKLIIGSANFTQMYGAHKKKVSSKEITKILDLAKKNNIYKIDTAESYLKNKCIFKKINKKFQFITKIQPDNNWTSLDYCKKELLGHFQKFNKNSIKILLFHDDKILFKKNGPVIFQNIETFKKKYFDKIGISIYETKKLNYLTKTYNIDVIQFPYNILDNSIIYSGWLKKLKNRGIEVHARSIFLQGLLVNKLIYKKKYFKKWKNLFSKWYKYLDVYNISPIDYCLNDATLYEFDQIIIGINNYDHLNEILNFKKLKNYNKLIKIKIMDKKLIDPRQWK